MAHIVAVVQEKGGVGKSTKARGLAEAVPAAKIFEIDSSPRLLEYGDRVQFFRMRADHAAIQASGGRAARAEFDQVIDALGAATEPTIVDVGANTSISFLSVLSDLGPELKAMGHQFAVVVVVTAEPAALAEVPRLLSLSKPWADAQFVIENQMRGAVDPGQLKKYADGVHHSVFAEQVIEDGAVKILQAAGLAAIPQLDPAALTKEFGLALGGRIRRDLAKFRLEAMQAVKPAAEWLIS